MYCTYLRASFTVIRKLFNAFAHLAVMAAVNNKPITKEIVISSLHYSVCTDKIVNIGSISILAWCYSIYGDLCAFNIKHCI